MFNVKTSKCGSISWTIVFVVFIHGSLVCAVFMFLLHEVQNAYTGQKIPFTRDNADSLCNHLQISLNNILTNSGLTGVVTTINKGSIQQYNNSTYLLEAPSQIQLNIGKGNGTFELKEVYYLKANDLRRDQASPYDLDIKYSSSRKMADILYDIFTKKNHIVLMQSEGLKYIPAKAAHLNASYYSYTLEKRVESTVKFKGQQDYKIITSLKGFIKDDEELPQTNKMFILSSILGDLDKAKIPSVMFFTFILGVIVLGLSPFIKEKTSQIYKCNGTCSLRVFIIFFPFVVLSTFVFIVFIVIKPCNELSISITALCLALFFSIALAFKKGIGHNRRAKYTIDHAHRCKTTEEMLAVINDFQKEAVCLKSITIFFIDNNDKFEPLKTNCFFTTPDISQQTETICNDSKNLIQKSRGCETDYKVHDLRQLSIFTTTLLKKIQDFCDNLTTLNKFNNNLQIKSTKEKKYQRTLKDQITITRRALAKLERQQIMVLQDITTPIRKRTCTGLTPYSNSNKAT